MRLRFDGIEAAAEVARARPASQADAVEDCEGEELAALVDLVGDDEYEHSKQVDFEPELQRRAAGTLRAALASALEFLRANDDGEDDIGRRIAAATAALAKADAAGVPAGEDRPASRFAIDHDPRAHPDRVHVAVDGTFDVAIIRTDEGVVVDVYPGFLTRGMESGCLLCHRLIYHNHLRHPEKAAR